jgi:Na+-transporting NADH:ubiquinone oxidoreductase subunit NqrC
MMTTAEALDALRPLIAQRRALDRLSEILEVAHLADGERAKLEKQWREIRRRKAQQREIGEKAKTLEAERAADAALQGGRSVTSNSTRNVTYNATFNGVGGMGVSDAIARSLAGV